MTPIKLQVYLEDEAPKIGAGWRLVHATVGRKWVRMVEVGSERKAKLTVKIWEQLKKGEPIHESDPDRPHREEGLRG